MPIARRIDEYPANHRRAAGVEMTPRQAAVLDYIRSYIQDRCRPPTYRVIMGHFGMKSPNGIMVHLKALIKKGYIKSTDDITPVGYRAVLVKDGGQCQES